MPTIKSEPLGDPIPQAEQLQDAEWVAEMRTYFAQSGYFRPEDVAKVLGDPLQHADAPIDYSRSVGSRLFDR